MRFKPSVRACALTAVVLSSSVTFGAQGPGKVNYQGVLRDAAGKPRAGSFDMIFRFYDAPTGGNEILVDRHEASGTGAVTVTTGLFSTTLGGGTIQDGAGPGVYGSLRDVFKSNEAVYLEVTIGGETLSPRTQVLSSAYTLGIPVSDGPCFDTSNRFVDCNNGTVTDAQTGLIWLKDASCLGSLQWMNASSAAADLQSGQCGLTDGSAKGAWRLPTKTEWEGIMKASCPAPIFTDSTGTGCHSSGPQWASDVTASGGYWSSTNGPNSAGVAWILYTTFGTSQHFKSENWNAWPVRSGR